MNLRPNRPLHARPARDWKVTVVLALTMLVVAMLAIGTPAVIQGSNTSRALKSSADLASCRSLYNAAVSDSRVALDDARATSESLQDSFLAGLGGDRSKLGVLLVRLGQASREIDAAREGENRANDVYQAAIKLSKKDPMKFLDQCGKDFD